METAVVVKDLNVNRLVDVFYGDSEALLPLGVQVLEDRPTPVHLLAADLELHIRVACA